MAPIDEKMTETRLRWFGHVKRRPRETSVNRVNLMISSLTKKMTLRSDRFILFDFSRGYYSVH